MKKYEFTGETKEFLGRALHRIRAVIDFGDVKAGDLGGWIEKEENLSHERNAWVCGNAKVWGDAKVCGNAKVWGDAEVLGDAEVWGDAKVCDNAKVWGDAKVCDNAKVCGNAKVWGDAEVLGNAKVCGNAKVWGDAKVWGAYHCLIAGPMGSRNDFTTFFRSKNLEICVTCGCFRGNIDAFAEKVKETHGDNEHAKRYMAAIEFAKACIDLTPEAE